MKSFKEYISGKSGLGFREVINELTDVELEERVQDYIQTEFKTCNLHFVSNNEALAFGEGVTVCPKCGCNEIFSFHGSNTCLNKDCDWAN